MADNDTDKNTNESTDKKDKISLWDILSGALTPEQELLEKQINYLLRKWASFGIIDVTASVLGEQQTQREPLKKWRVIMRPGRTAELKLLAENEGEGDSDGGSGWLIYDLGDMLLTSRPDAVAADYIGLAEFMIVVDKMVELAAEKGMQMVNIEGYGGDIAWVAVEKFNIKQGKEDAIVVLNYGPTEKHATIYEKEILAPLQNR